jgi:signal transduction histidine kinase/CheY-like chemotaxis protein/HPt (histidine-containing phosphotransfer) domain-containing protein
MNPTSKHNFKSVIRKILAAFLLLTAAIFLAVTIARVSFEELMGTVDKMSEPNQKLLILNGLFEEITTLDQNQRAEAIRNPHKPYQTFIDQSLTISSMIDSLLILDWDRSQKRKLSTMKSVLNERNELFFSYLKVKANLHDNKEFSGQLDTLEAILQNDELTIDSSLLKAHKITTTTVLRDTATLKKTDQRSLLKKLFSKKKKTPIDTPKIRVQEELSYVFDTTALARQSETLKEIEKIMKNMENDQLDKRKKFQRQELELINANSLFINQLLNILHGVEKEELAQIEKDNSHAVRIINQSVSRINYLMLGFFLAAAVLVYFIWIDITRSNFYKEQLEKARDKAEELTKIKQRFLANMSHEIRTPLQSIIGFAEQLLGKATQNTEEVEAIHSSSEHLLHIVNEVLDYSRISSGNITLANENFKLLAIIKEVEASMRIQADKKNLTFVVDVEKASNVILIGDSFRLKQILYNLLGNAIKFTPRGFVKLSVRTTVHEAAVQCIFEVVDTGIGIEKNEIDNIFNQFEQANSDIPKIYGGTGLGLTIVKSLVEVQGGKIEVSSEPQVGTSFCIELMFAKAQEAKAEKATPLVAAYKQSFNGKVIVVDDDGLILHLCSLILKKHQVNFATFDKANELLNREADPEVTHIFMDIRMPDINGVELCKRLGKIYPASTKFFALTAHVLPEEKNNLLNEGFDNILTKPFHEKEMLESLGLQVPVVEETDDKPNLELLKKMTMGDEVLYQSIVVQFIEETMDDIVASRKAVTELDAGTLRETVHKMSGRLGQLGVVSVAGKLRKLETDLVNKKPLVDLTPEINKILKKVNDVVIQIRLTSLEAQN